VVEFHKGNELETFGQTECTYWQSDGLLVEQTGMHLLAVCLLVEQAKIHLLSLSVFLLNKLKCACWQFDSLAVEQTETHLLAVWPSFCLAD
jgi:hypothetical protein